MGIVNFNSELEEIEKLSVSEEAREVLRRTLKVAGSKNHILKGTVKDLFITCPHGAGLSEYARAYEQIIVGNDVYRVRGKETYLELAFPKMGTEKDYADFFNSTRLVAATINVFAGVFLVSFEQFETYSELVRESAFAELLKFIDANRKTISFVFHVLPEFSEGEKLARTLSSYVNLERVVLSKPELDDGMNYIENQFKKMNLVFTQGARKQLYECICAKIDPTSKAYLGYSSLDRFVQNMLFEVVCMCDEEKDGIRKIDSGFMKKLLESVEFVLDERETKCTLGFR